MLKEVHKDEKHFSSACEFEFTAQENQSMINW